MPFGRLKQRPTVRTELEGGVSEPFRGGTAAAERGLVSPLRIQLIFAPKVGQSVTADQRSEMCLFSVKSEYWLGRMGRTRIEKQERQAVIGDHRQPQ
jgi:hypothetical protein